jgi:hypothetical protein
MNSAPTNDNKYPSIKETLESPAFPRDNGAVIAGQD